MTHTTIDTPIGTLTIVAGEAGLTSITMEDHRPAPDEATWGERDDAPAAGSPLAEAAAQLRAYFAGDRTAFALPLAEVGTPFQRRVWAALAEIPFGETRTYGWIAERIGQPTAVRAVGLANGRNPFSIVVPCHRVVGSTGQLTGYAGGVERKRHLLDHERGARLDSVA
ncbi:methylated-DNA--[protein]-cysteine S-methyltransferase [Agrococcus terreus]|uniref:methylated-DNA--[protein]-cysteine S-methyltransferase n=1 Tax=Agrococcus terreus TaxID=574649 RepID=UPI00384A9074